MFAGKFCLTRDFLKIVNFKYIKELLYRIWQQITLVLKFNFSVNRCQSLKEINYL